MKPSNTTGTLTKPSKPSPALNADKKIPHKVTHFMGFLFYSDYLTTLKTGRAFTGFSALVAGFLGDGG
jgi:hypothetical protein